MNSIAPLTHEFFWHLDELKFPIALIKGKRIIFKNSTFSNLFEREQKISKVEDFCVEKESKEEVRKLLTNNKCGFFSLKMEKVKGFDFPIYAHFFKFKYRNRWYVVFFPNLMEKDSYNAFIVIANYLNIPFAVLSKDNKEVEFMNLEMTKLFGEEPIPFVESAKEKVNIFDITEIAETVEDSLDSNYIERREFLYKDSWYEVLVIPVHLKLFIFVYPVTFRKKYFRILSDYIEKLVIMEVIINSLMNIRTLSELLKKIFEVIKDQIGIEKIFVIGKKKGKPLLIFAFYNNQIFENIELEKEDLLYKVFEEGEEVEIKDVRTSGYPTILNFDVKSFRISETYYFVPIGYSLNPSLMIGFGTQGYNAFSVLDKEILKSIAYQINLSIKIYETKFQLRKEKDKERIFLTKDKETGFFHSQYIHYWIASRFSEHEMGETMATLLRFKLTSDYIDKIKDFAEILKSCVRKQDKIVRLSRDEFLVILPGSSKNNMEKVLSRIDNRIVKKFENIQTLPITSFLEIEKTSKIEDISLKVEDFLKRNLVE